MARTPEPHRREDIIEAAKRAFRAKGFAATHMSDVAARADIAVGTLYLYFDSKEAIARAIAAEWFARAGNAVMPLLEGELTRARIKRIVHGTFDVLFDDEAFGRTGVQIGDVSIMAPDSYGAFTAAIADAFARQMRAGSVRKYDPAALADMFVILVRRAVLRSAESNREREPYATTLINFLAAALLPPRKGAKPASRVRAAV